MDSQLENELIYNKHIFICIDDQLSNIDSKYTNEINHLKKYFCGKIVSNLNNLTLDPNIIVYVSGDIKQNMEKIKISDNVINIVEELSYNCDGYFECNFIGIGEIPINVNNVGVYFRQFFDINKNYFDSISKEHQFQTLKESNKPNTAFRTGIYLSKVTQSEDNIHFNLLRCSTNFEGPTENFRQTDNEIISKVNNNIVENFYDKKTNLNHVLAQIYKNTSEGGQNKKSQKKAKIKEHSDKTKDMPRNGLIAFCTFYENYYEGTFNDMKIKKFNKSSTDSYDYCYNNISVLTRMRFRLKKDVDDNNLVKQFDIILYPNSVFLISLKMNRLYTHEILPSILPIENIPTRMGYVIRCSKTKAVYKDNQVYLIDNNNLSKLEKPKEEGIKKLKDAYFKENMTSNMITYDTFYFSLNDGDYQKPNL